MFSCKLLLGMEFPMQSACYLATRLCPFRNGIRTDT
jgi:hypothetical protein